MKCQALKMFLLVCIQFVEVKHHGNCNKVLIKVFNLHWIIDEIALETVTVLRIFLSRA